MHTATWVYGKYLGSEVLDACDTQFFVALTIRSATRHVRLYGAFTVQVRDLSKAVSCMLGKDLEQR